jgi:hypothetical protein
MESAEGDLSGLSGFCRKRELVDGVDGERGAGMSGDRVPPVSRIAVYPLPSAD